MPGSSLSRHLESGVDPGNEVEVGVIIVLLTMVLSSAIQIDSMLPCVCSVIDHR